jgi:hypothetical protein
MSQGAAAAGQQMAQPVYPSFGNNRSVPGLTFRANKRLAQRLAREKLGIANPWQRGRLRRDLSYVTEARKPEFVVYSDVGQMECVST